jgi:hypothetical protein
VGLSTLERDALDGRLEIHVVLDDTDTKLTALERPPTARRRWRAVQSHEALAALGHPHPRRSGHVLRLQTDARSSSGPGASTSMTRALEITRMQKRGLRRRFSTLRSDRRVRSGCGRELLGRVV